MYKLIIFTPEGKVDSYISNYKPSFEDMYQHIGCNLIEPSTAYLPKYSNRKDGYVEFYMDEEFLMKNPVPQVNEEITQAWYLWQKNTGHTAISGSKIHGKIAVIQKVKHERC